MKKEIIVRGFYALVFLLLLIYIIVEDFKSNENKGIITLAFDDGLISQYKIAFEEMQNYGYNGTLFLLANWSGAFEGRSLMTFEEAKEMQNKGWEIGSHTLNHKNLTALSNEELIIELEASKEILEKKGFKIKSIAFPFGIYNKKVIEETKKYYSASRPMEDGFNNIKNPNCYNLKSKWVMKKYSSEQICSWIKEANNKGLWLILNFHNIGEEDTLWDFSEQKFKEVMGCIDKEGIEIKTIKEVLENEKGE